MNKTTRVYELVGTLFIAVLCLFLLITALNTPTAKRVYGIGPLAFPIVLFITMLCLCTIIIATNISAMIKNKKTEETQTGEQKAENRFVRIDKRIYITMVLIVLYALMWNIIGFFLSTILYFTVQAKVLDRKKSWLLCAIISVAIVVFIYFVFGKLFMIPFPEPLFEKVLG